jgi:isoquinoline 1-oxidoreductase alpha subunit
MMVTLSVNGKTHTLDIDDDMPLLWALRDILNLTGTKYGCGISMCGACTVHLDGQAIRSCSIPASAVQGKAITTIEGIDSLVANAVQTAWEKLNVVQCGYCQSGQIMAAIDLLSKTPNPTDDQINQAMSGNICRCNTYVRIRAAIHEAASTLAAKESAA